jgi:HD-GYP domain-containing protein (c-di-GMP phosphodiesterase class II)
MPDAKSSTFDPETERLLAEARERGRHSFSRRERITYWVSTAGFAAASLGLLVGTGTTRALPHDWVVALLVLSYALASRLEFEVGSTSAIPTELVLVEMLFLLPPAQVPLWVLAAGFLGQLPEYLSRVIPVERALVLVGSSWFALGPALVFALFDEPAPQMTARTVGVLALALGAQFAVDGATSAAREWGALKVPPSRTVSGMALVYTIDLVLAPIGLLAAIAATQGETGLLLPLPLLFVIALTTRERQKRMDQALELSSAYRGTALLLGDVVEADDAYTGAHSRDVLDLVLAVADDLQVTGRQRVDAEFAALLHDIGKLRVPAEIINKPGPLTPEERALMNTHTVEGQRMLQRVGGRLAEVGTVVRSCHERWDGGGYPDGLAGAEIPLAARIVCCCDAFSAMTTDRPYRKALSLDEALAELEANAGSQFDPDVVHSLLRLVRHTSLLSDRPADLLEGSAQAPEAVRNLHVVLAD